MNNQTLNFIHEHYPQHKKIETLTGGGSGRNYFRVFFGNDQHIVCHNTNPRENECFFLIAEKLETILPHSIPKIYFVTKDSTIYSQMDCGDDNLLKLRSFDPKKSMDLYEQAVRDLALMQYKGAKILKESDFFDSPRFNGMLVYRDLFYFKDFFLDFSKNAYSQYLLLEDFKKIATNFAKSSNQFFLYRDFQARNILVKNNQLYYIDFQGGMMGPSAYDLVSLLWQAKAEMQEEEKNFLIQVYTEQICSINPDFDLKNFWQDYTVSVVLRLLQVVGAYGKLGVLGGKSYFRESLSLGVKNLKNLVENGLLDEYKEIKRLLQNLESAEDWNFSNRN